MIGVSVSAAGGSCVAKVVVVGDSAKGVEYQNRICRCDEDDAYPLCSLL